jgi:TonB-dependent SusC/RagA subfamily outer membrane receptor
MIKIYLLKRIGFTALFLVISSIAWSQSKPVSGKVISADDGAGIPGVNIMEKGTTNGAVTNEIGDFTINVSDNATLVFTFVGYETQELAVGTQSTINIRLQPDVTTLSEVVVIGYGEVRKRDATGAVASVKAEDFNRGVISSPEQLIQGKSAGVQITSASGEPGAGANIRIRGTSSVRGGNNPLFVVDGIPLSGEEISAGGLDLGRGNAPTKNPLNFINPNDIESIDILKDASATAIYGSRGANGVVIITTKSGKGTKRQLEYSPTLSFSTMANRYDLLNRDQFLTNAAALGSNVAELDMGHDTDWQKEISRTSVSHRHDLSFSNNLKSGNYRVSLSYDNQQGVIKTSGMERLTGRVNANNSFFQDKLDLGLQLTLSKVNDQAAPITNNSGFEGDLIGSTYMANPTWSADPEVQPPSTNNISPASYLKYHQDKTTTDRALINLSAGYDITTALNFKVNVGFDRTQSTREKAFSSTLSLSNGILGNGRGAIAEIETSSDLLETYFDYKKNIGKGIVSAILGYSYQQFNRSGSTVLGWGFASPDMNSMVSDLHTSSRMIQDAIEDRSYQQFAYAPANLIGDNPIAPFYINSLFPTPQSTVPMPELSSPPPVKSVSGDFFDRTDELQSFFGRVNYTLRDKYLFTATVRADGSSKFGGNNRYGYFPSAAFAWRLSEETFMPAVFDDLKLRIGYGVTGNQEIPHNLYQARQRFGNGAPAIEANGRINSPGISNVAFQNPGLKWEQTTQLNAGVDFGFLQGKFSGTIDVYRKVTNDLLIQVTSAQPAPQQFTWRNLDADVINNGIELTLNYYAIDKEDVGLTVGFNVAYNTNMVERYDGAPLNTGEIHGQGLTSAFAQRIANGQPLFAYFIREFTGFDESGLATYNEDIQRYVGKSPIPKYNLGFSANARFKNWDVATFFNGQFGHYVYNNTANAYFNMGSLASGKNITTDVLTSGESITNAPDASTRFLEKGNFLRMQNFNIGYNLTVEQKFIKKLRVYISAQNVFVITGYSGLDPEVNTNKERDGVPSLGIDYTSYPRARTLTVGLNATF